MTLSDLELLDLKSRSPQYQPIAWARMAFWDPEEVATLSLGYDPSDPNLKANIRRDRKSLLGELESRILAATRAVAAQQISEECAPNKAIEWMDKYKISYPDALKAAVDEFYPITKRERVHSLVTGQLMRQIAVLRKDLAEAQNALSHLDEKISPKLRSSYEIIIAAMAHAKYGHDPAKKRTETSTKIAGDIAVLGLELTPPVISAHIKDAFRNQGVLSRRDQFD